MSELPMVTRNLVVERDGGRCIRCHGRGLEVHHRRSRSVHDEHTHCPCNLLTLCGMGNHTGCHGFAHSQPFKARPSGLLVRRSESDPGSVPLYLPFTDTWVLLGCDGQIFHVDPPREEAL